MKYDTEKRTRGGFGVLAKLLSGALLGMLPAPQAKPLPRFPKQRGPENISFADNDNATQESQAPTNRRR